MVPQIMKKLLSFAWVKLMLNAKNNILGCLKYNHISLVVITIIPFLFGFHACVQYIENVKTKLLNKYLFILRENYLIMELCQMCTSKSLFMTDFAILNIKLYGL